MYIQVLRMVLYAGVVGHLNIYTCNALFLFYHYGIEH